MPPFKPLLLAAGTALMLLEASGVGGTLDVGAVPGGGTRVRLTVPTVTSSAVA